MNIVRKPFPAFAALCAALLSACSASVNEDVHVTADTPRHGGAVTINGNVFVERDTIREGDDFSTVNGSIRIAERAHVKSVRAVNGSILLAEGARAHDVESVNGRCELGRDARVSGSVQLINGDVSLAPGSLVGGSVKTVHGTISAQGATIEGSVSNYQGGMLITDESVIKGSLTVRRPEEMASEGRPRVVIGPNSKVLGGLRFERPVELYLHESAQTGPIDGAEPVRYSGALPEAG